MGWAAWGVDRASPAQPTWPTWPTQPARPAHLMLVKGLYAVVGLTPSPGTWLAKLAKHALARTWHTTTPSRHGSCTCSSTRPPDPPSPPSPDAKWALM